MNLLNVWYKPQSEKGEEKASIYNAIFQSQIRNVASIYNPTTLQSQTRKHFLK